MHCGSAAGRALCCLRTAVLGASCLLAIAAPGRGAAGITPGARYDGACVPQYCVREVLAPGTLVVTELYGDDECRQGRAVVRIKISYRNNERRRFVLTYCVGPTDP